MQATRSKKAADEAAERAVGPEPSRILEPWAPILPPNDPKNIEKVTSIGRGQALDPEIRTFMESRMGADFSTVTIQTDGAAAKSAEDLGARAYAYRASRSFLHLALFSHRRRRGDGF